MTDDRFRLQIACKGCGKIFTFRTPGADATEFDSLEAAGRAYALWVGQEYLERAEREKNVQLFPCPTCKRAYRYTSHDVFLSFPPSTQYEMSSVIKLPIPD